MRMLKKAENKMAFAKVGIYGSAGSGKTHTASRIAIGLHQYAECKKPIGFFDTEPAASYVIPLFQEAGVEFLVYDESRALADLMRFMDEAEKECSIVIIDSITHVWRDAQESYLKKINTARARQNKRPLMALEFQHWRPIKSAWAEFTDRFLASKLHVIVCGRAGQIYEYQDKDDGTGKKELISTGTRMATEKELGHEPSLLIEMIGRRDGGKVINTALVEKDRTDKLNGKEIEMPDFAKLEPHFACLNLGGAHFESLDKRDSTEMFTEGGDDNWSHEQKQRVIWSEEVKGLLEKAHPGTSNEEKRAKADLLESIFNTRSWTRVENMRSDDIKTGYMELKELLQAAGKIEVVPILVVPNGNAEAVDTTADLPQ